MGLTMIVVERVPESMRGDLSRWMLEPRACVFVGNLSAMVRDSLWDRACDQSRSGACLMIHAANNEQGFEMRVHGDTSRAVVNFDGFVLVSNPKKSVNRPPDT